MRKVVLIVLLFCGFCSVSLASDPNVRVSEVSASFVRVAKAIKAVLGVSVKPSKLGGEHDGEATRAQIISEMSRLVESVRGSLTYTPTWVQFDAKLIKSRNDKGAVTNLSGLIKWGYVGPVSTLATGPAKGISIEDFGDALGFFIERLSDLTHTPRVKWSPYLMTGGS